MSDPEPRRIQSNDEPTATSGDRFVDALLTHKMCDSPQAMDRRLARAMRAVRGENHRLTAWQWWALPVAALIAVTFLIMPTTSSASAIVRTATRVARLAADRRYEVVMIPRARKPSDSPPPITATLDVRDADHVRLEIRFPDGRTEQRGRDGDVSWEVGRDGEVRVTDGSQPWPRWIETPDGSLLIDSMASMLDELEHTYTLTRVENTQCGGQSGLVQIDAVRKLKSAAAAMPPSKANPADRIVMCIDPTTNEVARLEMQFSQQGPPPRGERGPPQDGERGPPRDGERGPPQDGERGPPRDGERGPPQDGERGPPRDGERGPPRDGERRPAGPPQSLTFTRAALSEFPAGWFAAPSAN